MRHQKREVCEAQTTGLEEPKNDPGACSQQSNPANNCLPVWVVSCHFLSPAEPQDCGHLSIWPGHQRVLGACRRQELYNLKTITYMHRLVARLLVLHKAKLISDRLLAQAHHAFEGPTSPPALSGFEGLAEKDTYTACAAFAMIDGRGCKRLHSEFLEQSFGNQTYHEHYNPPKPGNVNHILPAFHSTGKYPAPRPREEPPAAASLFRNTMRVSTKPGFTVMTWTPLW